MIIFSNDYSSNYSRKKVSSGGPARFSGEFSAYAISQKNVWKGIAISTHNKRRISIREKKRGVKTLWEVKMDQEDVKAITRAAKKVDPEVALGDIIKKVRSIISKSSADIVFLNGFSIFNWIIMKAAFEEKKKIVIQHAGLFTREINMYADFFSAAGRKILLQMEKDITDYTATEIFLNDYSRQVYYQLVRKVPAEKSRVIPLPFSGKKVARPKFKKFDTTKDLSIGMIARWDRIKNHEAVLALGKEIKRQKLPWKIYSVTKIPETKAKLEFKNQYRKYIEVVPPMDYKQIIKFLGKMDLMILPSHFDVSPNVVIEAANEGLITFISPYVGWVNEYKRSNCSNLIVDYKKPKQVIAEIKKVSLRDQSTKINKMFLNFNKKHDKNLIFNDYLMLFKKLKVKN